jgi:hypothetical protein
MSQVFPFTNWSNDYPNKLGDEFHPKIKALCFNILSPTINIVMIVTLIPLFGLGGYFAKLLVE